MFGGTEENTWGIRYALNRMKWAPIGNGRKKWACSVFQVSIRSSTDCLNGHYSMEMTQWVQEWQPVVYSVYIIMMDACLEALRRTHGAFDMR
ncbi:hypothetical protein TNCV_238711 [Trichonephila clavipes]|nr:hypothetical protein TNCV_238711 [Trichonephila clavipes]